MLLQRNADPGPFPAPKQKFCRPHHKALSLLYDIQGPASSFNFFLLTAAQTIKKVLSSRHVRMDRTHTGKFDGESVRAALRRVRGSTANFVPRGIPGGRNFCRAAARRNGFPLERVVFDTPNNAGAGFAADPRRGTLSFVTQKFFCFGAINNRRNMVLFLFAATSDGCFTRACRWSLAPAHPLYHLPVWCPGGVISKS